MGINLRHSLRPALRQQLLLRSLWHTGACTSPRPHPRAVSGSWEAVSLGPFQPGPEKEPRGAWERTHCRGGREAVLGRAGRCSSSPESGHFFADSQGDDGSPWGCQRLSRRPCAAARFRLGRQLYRWGGRAPSG